MGRSYQDLVAWQKAMDFAEEIYTATRVSPKDELYGLTSVSSDSFLAMREVLCWKLKRRSAWQADCTIFQKSKLPVYSNCRQSWAAF